MGNWYRIGRVAVENDSTTIVGTGTLWATQAAAGDLFSLTGSKFYEVEVVTDDTHIELKTSYLEEDANDQTYLIIRNFTSTLSATLASKLAELLNRWDTKDDEWAAWHTGTVTGGPNNNGMYPFTDPQGDTILIACPAKLAQLNGYTYVAYASDASGTGFTQTFNATLDYIAFLRVSSPITSPQASHFAGLWKNYKGIQGLTGNTGAQGIQGIQGPTGNTGAQGIQGIQGQQGIQGDKAFCYIAYASDASGTGFTQTFNASLNYIAIKSTTTAIASPVVGDFAGLWFNYKGAQGAQGIQGIQGETGAPGAGNGDVLGPATNADNTIAQWSGANSKTLKALAATAESDFILSGASPFAWVKKTLAQTKTILGLLLTQTSESIGFTLSGGATSKTLTVTGNATISETPAGLGANTFTGEQILSDQLFSRAMLKDCGMTVVDRGNSGTTTQTIDYTAGCVQKITVTGAHTIATSNWPPTGNLGEILLELVNGASSAITWPTVNWVKSDGTTTTTFSANGVTLQSSGTDWIVLWTRNAGTTIYGKVVR